MIIRLHFVEIALFSLVTGVSIIACGVLFTWNYGLAAGFWEFIFAMLMMCLGYWCLTLCISEMASALPFNGEDSSFNSHKYPSTYFLLQVECMDLFD